jgi:hypothetical protein
MLLLPGRQSVTHTELMQAVTSAGAWFWFLLCSDLFFGNSEGQCWDVCGDCVEM